MRSARNTASPPTGRRAPHRPCPYCAAMLRADEAACPRCRLPLDEGTCAQIQRMHGPWFLYHSHVPTAPGVDWDKFRGLIRSGRVTPDSIVRGPTTGGLWRLARETPGVAERLGLCPACGAAVGKAARACPSCGAILDPDAGAAPAAGPGGTDDPDDTRAEELAALVAAGEDRPDDADGSARRADARRSALPWALAAGLALAATVGWLLALQGKAPPGEDLVPREPLLPALTAEGAAARPPATAAEPLPAAPRPASAPRGLPGELFADVPPLPRTRPAVPTAAEVYADALAAERDGDRLRAQSLLLTLLNDYPQPDWPAGAAEALARVQAALAQPREPRFFTPAGEPAPAPVDGADAPSVP